MKTVRAWCRFQSRQPNNLNDWIQCGRLHSLAIMAAFGSCCCFTPKTDAEGFKNPPAGAFNLGRAGGRIAQIDDSSSVAQNPANLMDLEAPEFLFAPSAVYIHV